MGARGTAGGPWTRLCSPLSTSAPSTSRLSMATRAPPVILYDVHLGVSQGDYASGHAFGQLGVEMSRRYADARQTSWTLLTFAANVNHWSRWWEPCCPTPSSSLLAVPSSSRSRERATPRGS